MSQATVSVLNDEIKAAVEAFAKSRNVPISACLQAAAMALAMQPYEEGGAASIASVADIVTVDVEGGKTTPSLKPVGKRIPRQAGTKSLEFRDAVIAKAADLKGKRHTFSEVAAMFNIDQANATNNLKWLQSHKKIDFRVVGFASKLAGKKGRAPAIIEFV